MWDAMNFSKGFVNSHEGHEITFVGHSKGGGEAIAAATYTHKNAITFNAANFAFEEYGLIEEDRTGQIDNYYVRGGGLSATIGVSKIGETHWLDTQYRIPITIGVGSVTIFVPDPYSNHLMGAVKRAL